MSDDDPLTLSRQAIMLRKDIKGWTQRLGQKGAVHYTRVGLKLDGEFTPDEWLELIAILNGVYTGSKLWLGDALVEGERRFGEMYQGAMSITGLEYGTITNLVYVARAVPQELRIEGLSTRHYAAVAPLANDPGGAEGRTAIEDFLRLAAEHDLTSEELRDRIKDWRAERERGVILEALEAEAGPSVRSALAALAAEKKLTPDELREEIDRWRAGQLDPTSVADDLDEAGEGSLGDELDDDVVRGDEIIQPAYTPPDLEVPPLALGQQAAQNLGLLVGAWEAEADQIADRLTAGTIKKEWGEARVETLLRCASDLAALLRTLVTDIEIYTYTYDDLPPT